MNPFEDTNSSMQDMFQRIVNPSVVEESKEVKKEETVIVESVELDAPKEPKVEKTPEVKPKFGSKFNALFESVFNDVVEEEFDDYSDIGSEGEEEEEVMVSVPASVIKELYEYLGGEGMDGEGAENPDDVGFEITEEAADIGGKGYDSNSKPKKAKSCLCSTTSTNGPKIVNDKTKTKGIGKTGTASECTKDRTGKVFKLRDALGSYLESGARYPSDKLKKDDVVLNK